MSRGESFPFNAMDVFTSGDLVVLSPAELGAYVRLMCFCWNSDDVAISANDECLARLSGLRHEWATSGELITRLFVRHPEKAGALTHPALWEEADKRKNWALKSSRGGKKSGEARTAFRANKKPVDFDSLEWHQTIPVESGSCVYLLIHEGNVMYEGTTQDLSNRIAQHKQSGKIFDDVQWAAVPLEQSIATEQALIRYYDSHTAPPVRNGLTK